MANKIYPISLSGIEKIGIEKFMKNYYIPVTAIEYQDIYKKVHSSYIENINQHNDEFVYWIAIANIKIIRSVSNYILEILQLQRLIEKGYEYIINEEKRKITDYIREGNYSSLSNINLTGKHMSRLRFQERVKNILKTIKYNLNPHVLTNFSSPVFFIGNRSQQEVVAYCNQNKIEPIRLSPMLFANNSYEKVNKDSKLNEILEFVYSFFVLLKKQFPEINSSLFELLKKEVEECFLWSLLFFRHNLRIFSTLKYKSLFATGLGNEPHRLFCSSWRYAGGEVTGFVHGNAFCNCYNSLYINELSLVDKYITGSIGQEEILNDVAIKFSQGLKMPKISHQRNNNYIEVFKKHQAGNVVHKVSKVMIVGFPVVDYMFFDIPDGNALSHFQVELRLMKILKEAGYYVQYNSHPVTSSSINNYFIRLADEVIIDKFEDNYIKADCLLFGNHTTTTFGFSLLTNKPMVLLNSKGTLWYPRAFELIKKRCSVVEAESVDGKIVFDEQDMLNAIECSLENIDYEILHEFAF